jgi:hypothetical protein
VGVLGSLILLYDEVLMLLVFFCFFVFLQSGPHDDGCARGAPLPRRRYCCADTSGLVLHWGLLVDVVNVIGG